MSNLNSEDHVLPRPVEPVPEFANAKSRQTLAEKLVACFRVSSAAATAIGNAVVDPSPVRKSIGEPDDPQVEFISVPGGTLLGIRTQVWARKIMPDPRNPRIGPSRRHPFAVEPGTGEDASKFRPIPEPRSPDGVSPETAELWVDVESRHHLTWAAQQAGTYVLANNDWTDSIKSQGVMEAVWLVPTTYRHADGSEPVTTLVTVEGSSRTTAVHSILGIRSADVPYDDNDTRLRTTLRQLNDAFSREHTVDIDVTLRCERVPALILVGFHRHPDAQTGFPTAVKSLVALRHVDPPKPWGEGPEGESLADEVLDELYRRDLISATERAYFAGACTKFEAEAAHLSPDPAIRAARIVKLFASADERFREAIRVAVTSQSTRKRITPKLARELATALVLRAVADDPAKVDQFRRYLRLAYGEAVNSASWASTDRPVDRLVQEALAEVRRATDDPAISDPGPASVELAVRAAYPLVIGGRLNRGDLGVARVGQSDRRFPGEILDNMRRSVHGVLQLGQALRDAAAGQALRAVDEDGRVRRMADGSRDQEISDAYLRAEFPPPGKARSDRPGDTPVEVLRNRMNALSQAVDELHRTFTAVADVRGEDGRPLVETRGVEIQSCDVWRKMLRDIDDDLNLWGKTFRRVFGNSSPPSTGDLAEDTVYDTSQSEGLPNDELDESGHPSEVTHNQEAVQPNF